MREQAADEPRDPLDLLSEEFLAAVRRGDPVTPEGFAAQHPERGPELRDLCETLLMLEGCKQDRESSATGGRRLVVPNFERLGEYRIVREVGRGGMGVVFEAVQESLDRRVALKVLPQTSLLTGNQLQRFRREAQTAARLHHTNIVPVFDSGEAEGLHYYAMQFIDGLGLDALVKSLRKDAPASASSVRRDRFRLVARIGAEVADALQYAHQHGALHRDVKPANILIDGDGRAWVTDFGLAKALEQNGLTEAGDVLGTLQYMAPEQFDGAYDARSEVYALGVTLYELACLRSAFVAESRAELIEKIRSAKSNPIRAAAPDIPRDLETILARAMASDPHRRYATAADMASDLRAYLEDRPIAARRQSRFELLWAWRRRNKALAATAAIAVLAVGVAAVVGWSSYLTTRSALDQAKASEAAATQASERDRANLSDSLQVFEDVFDTIVGPDPLYALLEDVEEGGATVAAMGAPIDEKSLALLERMLDFYDKFAARNVDNDALRQQTARSYARVGAIQQRLGSHEDSVTAYDRAVTLLRSSSTTAPDAELAAVLQELGQAQVRVGQPRQAAASYAESLRILGAIGSASHNERRLQARARYLLATAPGLREGRPEVGRRGGAGRPGAEERVLGGRRPGGRDPRTDPSRRPAGSPDAIPGNARSAMAAQAFEELRLQAKTHLDAAIGALRQLLVEMPADAESSFLLARCLLELSRHGFRSGDSAPEARTEALDLLRKLVEERPENDSYRFELCGALLPRPSWRGDRGSSAGVSSADASAALEQARILVSRRPKHPEFRLCLARALSQQGAKRHEAESAKDPRAGAVELEEAVAVLRELTQEKPSEARWALECIQAMRRLLRVRFDSGQLDEARGLGRELAQMMASVSRDGLIPPRGEEWFQDFAQLFERLGLQDSLREMREADRRRR